MEELVARSSLPVSAEELFAWHARDGALDRLLPPWQPVRIEQRGGIRDGDEVVLRFGRAPLTLRWVARHEGYDPPRSFEDRQVRGPFARWHHRHRFRASTEGARLEDAVEYELPLGSLGGRIGASAARRALERLFRFRHARTRNDLERHARTARDPQRIAVTGATGFVGSALCAFLRSGGHEVLRVTRSPREPSDVRWDPARKSLERSRLEGCDAVVHLAGENLLSLRWSDDKKRAIQESRVHGTRLIAEALAELKSPPRVLVAASAVGFYGDRSDATLDESASAGEGFLADVCRGWEAAAEPARQAGIRVVHPRFGVVLSAQGGALAAMLPAFRLALAGRLGSGEQWFPWVALDDALGAVQEAICGDLEGAVNVTSPHPVTNAEFTRTLAQVLGRPARVPVPASAMKWVLEDMADELLLSSARVLPARLTRADFPFLFAKLESALAFELGRSDPPPGFEFEHSDPPAGSAAR